MAAVNRQKADHNGDGVNARDRQDGKAGAGNRLRDVQRTMRDQWHHRRGFKKRM